MTAAGNKMRVRMYCQSTVVDQDLSQILLISVGFLYRGLLCMGLKAFFI